MALGQLCGPHREAVPRPLFARQDIYSDDCAICAITMLLRARGISTSRIAVSRWFVRRGVAFESISHSDVGLAIRHFAMVRRVSWQHRQFKTRAAFFRRAARYVTAASATLVTAHCVYRPLRIRSEHAFVLVGTNAKGLAILDSLSARPRTGRRSNALISATAAAAARRELDVHGAPWTLDLAHPVSFLRLEV